MTDNYIRTRRGKKLTPRQYLALVAMQQGREMSPNHPGAPACEHKHFGCAGWEGGPCSNEVAAGLPDAEEEI